MTQHFQFTFFWVPKAHSDPTLSLETQLYTLLFLKIMQISFNLNLL